MAAPAPSEDELRKRRRDAFYAEAAEGDDRADKQELDDVERDAVLERVRQKRRGATERVAQAQRASTRQARGGVDAGGVGPDGSTRPSSGGDSGGSSRDSARVAELEALIKAHNAQMEIFFNFFAYFMASNADVKAKFEENASSDVIKIYQTGKGIIDAGSNSGRK